MSRPRSNAGCLLLLLLFAGCGSIPTTHYYVLEPSDLTTARADPARGWDVAVEPFLVDPPYDQDRIVYRQDPGSAAIGFYTYHRWAAPLSRMLPRVVAGELAGTGGLRSIEPAAPGRNYAARMAGRLLMLEEVDAADGPRVRMRLRLTLRTGQDDAELWSEAIDVDGPVSAAEVAAVVQRFQDLLAEALRAARPGLERALAELSLE